MAVILNSRNLLKNLIGKNISQVRRQLFSSDMAIYGTGVRDQESDGPTEFLTVDGTVFHVISNTEQMAIDFLKGPYRKYGESYVERDVTSNAFWSTRTNKSIIHIDVLQSLYGPEVSSFAFGAEFFFKGAESFVIEYLSDEEHQDQIRITGPYAGPPCRRVPVV